MKISIIGTGYVGLVTGTCLAELGFNVKCVDNNNDKIQMLNQGQIPIYEPGLAELVRNNIENQRLSFSNNLTETLADSNIIFIAVGTPTDPKDGSADLSFLKTAISEIADNAQHDLTIVIKSTVPVGTCIMVQEILDKKAKYKCEVVSNPEFLREGSAVYDFMNPDRIIIGVTSDSARQKMSDIYQYLHSKGINILYTNTTTSEMIKYAANAFLATKIAFVDELANLCEHIDGQPNIDDLTLGIGLDKRIGKDHLKPGPGYGGSCFPKDTLAMAKIARDAKSPLSIVENVIKINDLRKASLFDKVKTIMGDDVENKTITILGLAFKKNTDDMRESASRPLVRSLITEHAKLKLYDPVAINEAKKYFAEIDQTNIEWCEDAYLACQNSEAVIIITEWDEFITLDMDKIAKLMRNKLIIDFRNIYNAHTLEKHKIQYFPIGKKYK